MRGLPPPPDDVVQLTQHWQIDVAQCTTIHWLLAPGAETATVPQLEDIANGWYFSVLPDFLRALATDVTLGALRLSSFGTAPVEFTFIPAPNSGSVPGSTSALNAAACMTWRTGTPQGSHAHARLPLPIAHVADDLVHLNELGFLETSAGASAAVGHAATIPSPAGGVCTLGTLHRSHAGAPLPAATFSPFVDGRAAAYIAYLDRRIRSRRRSSPVT